MSRICSSRLEISCGFPQGRIAGPVWFLLYMNHIVKSSNISKLTMYADDTCLLFDTHNLDQSIAILSCERNKVLRWLFQNHLTLNVTKTKHMIFHKLKTTLSSSYPPICIGIMS